MPFKNMSLKNRVLFLLIVSGVLSAGVLVILAVAFINYFPISSTLCLMLCLAATIVGWSFFYTARQKYLESINPKKKTYGNGNRKNKRKRWM